MGIIQHVSRNVQRWRGGQMVMRWIRTAVNEAEKKLRRVMGHQDIPKIVRAVAAHDNTPLTIDQKEAAA